MSGGASDRVEAVEALIGRALARLDLPTRVALLTGAEYWRTAAVESIGLRSMVLSDGVAGVRGEGWSARDPSVCFPSPAALGSTWDVELVRRLGGQVAVQARRKGVDVVLAPTVNLQRSALAGRHFEYFSEDPLLTGRLGAAYAAGLQAHGVAATAKHYVANDAETHRFSVDVRMDEQTLREVYLTPFEALVRSGVWLVMAAYNRVDGTTMTENRLLDDPLISEWAFDGVVVSDWYATRSVGPAARRGLTLVMPGPGGPWGAALVAEVAGGGVTEATIEDKARRLLRLAARVGALGASDRVDISDATDTAEFGSADHVGHPESTGAGGLDRLLREAAVAGVVLAANNGVLPLDPSALRRVAVVGPNAGDPTMQGGGSAEVVPESSVSVVTALVAALGPGVRVDHAVGARHRTGLRPLTNAMASCPTCGRPGVHVRYLDAEGRELRSEHAPDGRLIWFGDQLPPRAEVEVSARIRADAAGWWRLGAAGVGHFRLECAGEVVLDQDVRPARPSFASSFLDPPEVGVDLELGRDAELDLLLRHRPEHDVEFVKAVLGFRAPQPGPDAELATAVALAEAAEVTVVVVGTHSEIETEGRDRTTLGLPGRQDELVRRVAEVSPRTVVVVISGAPVALPWRDEVDAVVLVPFAGQQQGPAVAEVLLGVSEPGGRLATTWPPDDAAVLSTRPVDGVLRYVEGVNIGHRGWVATGATPAYWFGHGLGYTTWAYDRLAAPATVAAEVGVRVCVQVTNTGARVGKQVIQAYLARAESAVRRPPLWLAGFAVVRLNPGETREVDIELGPRAFQHWSVDDQAWSTESGAFQIFVGGSAGDRRLGAEIVVGQRLN